MTDTNVFTCIGGIAEQVAVQYALYGADVAQAIDIRRIINTGHDPHTVRDAQEKQCPEKRDSVLFPFTLDSKIQQEMICPSLGVPNRGIGMRPRGADGPAQNCVPTRSIRMF